MRPELKLKRVCTYVLGTQHNEPHRPEIHRILHRDSLCSGQVEMASERVMVVVVSGQDMDRRAELYEQFTHKLILAVGGVIRPGRRTSTPHPEHLENGTPTRPPPSARDGITTSPGRADVGIAELNEKERSGHAEASMIRGRVPIGRQSRGSRVGRAGIEPATLGLKVRTESLRRHVTG